MRYLYVYQRPGARRRRDRPRPARSSPSPGLEDIAIGETLADPENPVALPVIQVEEPTVRMTFGVNTSPFAGREGRWGTSRKLRERLFEELRHNVALRVAETDSADTFVVSGRGELHLAILIETMRREGYEFQVSRPEVIFHQGEGGEMLEPFEEVHIETTSDAMGTVVEMLGKRRGQMLDMVNTTDGVRLTYVVPTRGLLGLPLPVPDRHARHGHDEHALPRLRADGRGGRVALQRLAGGLGSGRVDQLRPQERRGARSCSSAPAWKSTRAWSSASTHAARTWRSTCARRST